MNHTLPGMVLVHDTWFNPDHLCGVHDVLTRIGWEVKTPTLYGHGRHSDHHGTVADEVASVADAIYAFGRAARPVVVVAHGWAATTASLAAARHLDQVTRVVYLAGILPATPRSLQDEVAEVDPTAVGLYDRLDPLGRILPPPPEKWRVLYGNTIGADAPAGVPADVRAERAAGLVERLHQTLTPVPGVHLTTSMDLTAWYRLTRAGAVPTCYIHLRDDNAHRLTGRFTGYARNLGCPGEFFIPGDHALPAHQGATVARTIHNAAVDPSRRDLRLFTFGGRR